MFTLIALGLTAVLLSASWALNIATYRRTRTNQHHNQEVRAAEKRWREHNRRARIAGCKCGRPGTHVRYCHAVTGRVPSEIWSCAEHVNVNGWSGYGDGKLVPTDEYSEAALNWVTAPVEANPNQLNY